MADQSLEEGDSSYSMKNVRKPTDALLASDGGDDEIGNGSGFGDEDDEGDIVKEYKGDSKLAKALYATADAINHRWQICAFIGAIIIIVLIIIVVWLAVKNAQMSTPTPSASTSSMTNTVIKELKLLDVAKYVIQAYFNTEKQVAESTMIDIKTT